MKFYKFLSLGISLALTFSVSAQNLDADSLLDFTQLDQHQYSENYDDLVAGNFLEKFKKKRKKKKQKFVLEDTWRPFFVKNALIEPRKSYFFQMNLGIGFLRFSGIQGGTSHSGQNTAQFQLRGALNYTRTPLFEANLGAKVLEWLSVALAYQHQGVVDIQSERQEARVLSATAQIIDQFKANLRLDAIYGKVYFTYPSSLIWKTIAYSPYLGVGFGVSYQSWTDIQVQSEVISGGSTNSTHIKNYKNKYSPNAFYMFDLGINIRSARPSLPFSVRVGCKYNGWGQARSMGVGAQQNTSLSLAKPIHIKVVYQFAPYMGVQWNY